MVAGKKTAVQNALTVADPARIRRRGRYRLRDLRSLHAEMPRDRVSASRVNPITATSAVRTPGAASLIPDTFPTEPVEYLAETVLAMCHLPARERTGLITFSLHYPWARKLTVHSLDGTVTLPPLPPPANTNPNILADGV